MLSINLILYYFEIVIHRSRGARSGYSFGADTQGVKYNRQLSYGVDVAPNRPLRNRKNISVSNIWSISKKLNQKFIHVTFEKHYNGRINPES